jgi:curved DNA-binding protein CbpA
MAKTLYQLLGLAPNAKLEAIKEAYVKHAARLRDSGATGEAEVLKQAYEVLSDPRLRARYDQQAYAVGGEVAGADPEERHWIRSWKGALVAVVVLGVIFSAWSYNKREQTRIRLEHERIEAQRFAAEQQRTEELRQREAERRATEERDRIAAETAAAQGANQRSRSETLYRDTLQHQRTMQDDRLQIQRDRDAARREDLERRRLELENQRQLARDKRQAQELERTSPRRF